MTNDNAANYACILQTVSTNTITDFIIQGNSFKSANTYSNIYLLGVTGGRISDGVISNNIIRGGAFGIGLDYTDRIIVDSNSIVGFVTKAISVSANNTSARLNQNNMAILTTGTAYTIQEGDKTIISRFNGTTNVVLPDPTKWAGRELEFFCVYNSTMYNSSANIIPIGSLTPINYLVTTGWYWAKVQSDGTYWQTVYRGF